MFGGDDLLAAVQKRVSVHLVTQRWCVCVGDSGDYSGSDVVCW